MLFFLLCGVAVITVYYFSYIILGKKIKSRTLIAIIPTLITAFSFVWLIIDERYIVVTYILYILAFIVIFTFVISSFIKKHIRVAIVTLIPALVSLYFILWLIKETYYNPTPCNVDDGCMNETGMILVFSYFCMALSFIMVVILYTVKSGFLEKDD